MDLITISEVSKIYQVSTRTLRYYEEIGLISSTIRTDYAYRVYTGQMIERLQIILLLRKLDISLKDISKVILKNESRTLMDILNNKLSAMEEESKYFNALKEIIELLMNFLNQHAFNNMILELVEYNKVMQSMIDLPLESKRLKEKKMMNVNGKSSTLNDVRINYVPPFTVASFHCTDSYEPEEAAGKQLRTFIEAVNLCKLKPDLRVFGFNNPNPDESGRHGYEYWVTIPDEMELESPGIKKSFEGGLYAAHCINMGNFHEWQDFSNWLKDQNEYVYDRREPLGMDGSMEEHLNVFHVYQNSDGEFVQIDLLMPIRKVL